MKNYPNGTLNIKTLITIFVALGLDMETAKELLVLVGLGFKSGDIVHETYKFIIDTLYDEDLEYINKYLKILDFEELSSKEYI